MTAYVVEQISGPTYAEVRFPTCGSDGRAQLGDNLCNDCGKWFRVREDVDDVDELVDPASATSAGVSDS